MTERNWLIRTESKKILGPLSKQKVVEFVQNGTLSGEDEICSGNGYWFWVKEEDLLNKFLYGDEEQTFNPVAEAKTKVANSVTKLVKTSGIVEKISKENGDEIPATPLSSENPATDISTTINDEEEILLPAEDDLDFPEPIDYSDTAVAAPSSEPNIVQEKPLADVANDESISLAEATSAMDIEEEEVILPSSDDLDFPDIGGVSESTPAEEVAQEVSQVSQIDQFVEEVEKNKEDELAAQAEEILKSEKKQPPTAPDLDSIEDDNIEPMKAVEMPRPSKKKKSGAKKKSKAKKKKRKNDYSFVYIAIAVLIVLLFFISKFYSKLVGKELFSDIQFKTPTSLVYAQEFRSQDKKKRFF